MPPAQVLGPRHPHGTRIRYMGGCRCLPCRAANARYATECRVRCEAGESNEIVSAASARKHLEALGAMGVGYKTVARVARVSRTVAAKIRFGHRAHCRRQVRDRILEVGRWAIADGAHVDARPTWKRIEEIRAAGWPKVKIAEAPGNKRALQIGRRRCTAGHARAIRRLHRQVCGGRTG